MEVLNRDQVAHLLLGDTQDRLLPGSHGRPLGLGNLRAAERVGGEQVLDHERVLDLRGDVEEQARVVAPIELRGWRGDGLGGERPGRRLEHRTQVTTHPRTHRAEAFMESQNRNRSSAASSAAPCQRRHRHARPGRSPNMADSLERSEIAQRVRPPRPEATPALIDSRPGASASVRPRETHRTPFPWQLTVVDRTCSVREFSTATKLLVSVATGTRGQAKQKRQTRRAISDRPARRPPRPEATPALSTVSRGASHTADTLKNELSGGDRDDHAVRALFHFEVCSRTYPSSWPDRSVACDRRDRLDGRSDVCLGWRCGHVNTSVLPNASAIGTAPFL